jgi:hypothetical protein
VKEGLERGRLVSYGKMADQLRESALYETVPLMTSMLRDGFMPVLFMSRILSGRNSMVTIISGVYVEI